MRIGNLCSLYHLFHGGILHAEGYIVEYGIIEKNRLLVHIADEAAKIGVTQFPDIDAIDLDRTCGDIVKTGNQVNQSGFSGAGLTHDGNGLAFLYGKVDTLENLLSVLVAEVYAIKGDIGLEAVDGPGIGNLCDGVLGIQNLVDSLH